MPRKPGLPSGFKVGTKKEDLETPAVAGSFLEETLGLSGTAAPAVPEAPPEPDQVVEDDHLAVDDDAEAETERDEKVVQIRPPAPPRSEPEPARASRAESAVTEHRGGGGVGAEAARPQRERPARSSPPRKQINLKPHVIAMAEELLDQIRAETGQKDAASSEMFEGMTLMLQEARSHLELTSVPPRGAWGSKTAKAFPVSLKKQFIRAVGKLYLESYREEGG